MRHLHLIRRITAKQSGLKRYFTGKPCQRGNFAERVVSSKDCLCTACGESKNAKKAEHYAANKDLILAVMRQARKDDPEKQRAAAKSKYLRNREKIRETANKKYRENLEESRAKAREQSRKYKDQRLKYNRENPHLAAAYIAKRRAVKKERIPSWFGEFDRFVTMEAAELVKLREKATGIEWHIDHMIPLQGALASGLHCGKNLQVIPAYLNRSKSNKLWLHEPDQWLKALRDVASPPQPEVYFD